MTPVRLLTDLSQLLHLYTTIIWGRIKGLGLQRSNSRLLVGYKEVMAKNVCECVFK